MVGVKQIETIKKQVSILKRIADDMDDYEAARAIFRHADEIANQLDEAELLALPATDDVPLAA